MTRTDPTLDALKRLDEPGAFVIRRNVPIFMEHEDAVSGDKVDKARLQELAEINNRRTRESGTPGSIVIGHTPGRKEEEIQHVGYKKNYHVGVFGPKQKLGLLCDFYFKPEKYLKAMDYPHRSIELWNDGIIDTVSVLARTPQLDLGLLLPEAGPTHKTQLASVGNDGAELNCYSRGGERRIYQLCEESPMDNPRVIELLEQIKAEFSKMATPPDPKGLVTYSKEDHQKLLDEHVKLKKERDDAIKLYQKQGRQQALETLKNEGVQLDVEEELNDVLSLDDAAFTKHVEKVKKCYQRSPVGGGFIGTEAPPGGEKADYDRNAVRKYASTHGVSIPDAVAAVQAGKA